ncbi:hypothetical protein BJ912DRAFT_927225 [Pholiota molesta]|nr:hypothetical protein BJ912DRAFT_927225 [Pholiota molesta]
MWIRNLVGSVVLFNASARKSGIGREVEIREGIPVKPCGGHVRDPRKQQHDNRLNNDAPDLHRRHPFMFSMQSHLHPKSSSPHSRLLPAPWLGTHVWKRHDSSAPHAYGTFPLVLGSVIDSLAISSHSALPKQTLIDILSCFLPLDALTCMRDRSSPSRPPCQATFHPQNHRRQLFARPSRQSLQLHALGPPRGVPGVDLLVMHKLHDALSPPAARPHPSSPNPFLREYTSPPSLRIRSSANTPHAPSSPASPLPPYPLHACSPQHAWTKLARPGLVASVFHLGYKCAIPCSGTPSGAGAQKPQAMHDYQPSISTVFPWPLRPRLLPAPSLGMQGDQQPPQYAPLRCELHPRWVPPASKGLLFNPTTVIHLSDIITDMTQSSQLYKQTIDHKGGLTGAPDQLVSDTAVPAVDGQITTPGSTNSTDIPTRRSFSRHAPSRRSPRAYELAFSGSGTGPNDRDASIHGTAFLTFTTVNNATYNIARCEAFCDTIDNCGFVDLFYECNNPHFDAGPSNLICTAYADDSSGFSLTSLVDPATLEGYELIPSMLRRMLKVIWVLPSFIATMLMPGRNNVILAGPTPKEANYSFPLMQHRQQRRPRQPLSRGYQRINQVIDGGFEGFDACADFCFAESDGTWIGTSPAGGTLDATIFFFQPFAHSGNAVALLGSATASDALAGTLTPALPLNTFLGREFSIGFFHSSSFSPPDEAAMCSGTRSRSRRSIWGSAISSSSSSICTNYKPTIPTPSPPKPEGTTKDTFFTPTEPSTSTSAHRHLLNSLSVTSRTSRTRPSNATPSNSSRSPYSQSASTSAQRSMDGLPQPQGRHGQSASVDIFPRRKPPKKNPKKANMEPHFF